MSAATLANDQITLTDRTRRVLELRRAIMEGTYRVDAQAVAAALLREWSRNANLTVDLKIEAAMMKSMSRFVVRPGEAVESVVGRRILTA